ncbi:Uncharacterised protein [Escherichia coli]|uniref:Uncharacterized protein n=1 Tax=Escherichia coli TaxID=562 RepID=A0A485JEZ6_ECOLX|nr:Uncharacterised protein [Escherichia coli]
MADFDNLFDAAIARADERYAGTGAYGSAHRQGLQILPGSIHLVILTIFTLQSEIMRLV